MLRNTEPAPTKGSMRHSPLGKCLPISSSRGYFPPAHFRKARFFFMLTDYLHSLRLWRKLRQHPALYTLLKIGLNLMQRLRPRVFRLHVGWQRGNGTFCFIFGSINTTHQHIPRLTVTGRLINHVVFQIRFLRPTVEVVIVGRTAQLQRVVTGWRRFQ